MTFWPATLDYAPADLEPAGTDSGPAPARTRGSLLGIVGALALLAARGAGLIGTAILVHALRTEPRNATMLVTRELANGMLDEGEHPLRTVSVIRRSAADYFRATRGMLVLTERRLIYVGLTPRDILDPGDELPTFEQLSLTTDTTIALSTGRMLIGNLPALVISTPYDRTVLGVKEGWPGALQLLTEVRARQEALRADAVRQRRAREEAEAAARRPVYHVIRRGEALEVIARRYNLTIERLRELNGLTGNRVRAGDSLLVKPGT